MANGIGQGVTAVFMLSSVVESSHFRGGTIQWRPLNPQAFDGMIEIYQRFAWTWSATSKFLCNTAHIGTTRLFGQGDSIDCRSGCSGTVGHANVYCTNTIVTKWMVGERTYTYNMGNVTNFEISYRSDGWIALAAGTGFQSEIRVRGNLSLRQDLGWVNSSPSTTFAPLRLQGGCTHNISIPVWDLDQDIVRCRWARGTEECGGPCLRLPGAVLNKDTCIIRWTAPNSFRLYVVAIQIEDFATPQSTVPLSSVPLHFVLNSFPRVAPCIGGNRPTFVPGESPANGACITVPSGTTYRTSIVATSGSPSFRVIWFLNASPFKLRTTSATRSQHISTYSYVNVTWTPRASQTGVNLFCFQAQSTSGLLSERRCVTLLLGMVPPNPMVRSVSPTGGLTLTFLSPISRWNITFDRNITRPRVSRYVRFYEAVSGRNIYNIDVRSSEAYYSLSTNMLTLSLITNLTAGLEYYILMDSGAAIHACGDSQGITDRNFWTFSIARLIVHLDIAEPILTKLETTTIECTVSLGSGKSDLTLWRNGELLVQVTGDYLIHTTIPRSHGNYTCVADGFRNSSLLYERAEFQLRLKDISTQQCNLIMNEQDDLKEAILTIFRTTCPPCDHPRLNSIVDTNLSCSDSGDYAHFTAALVYTSRNGLTTASIFINNFQRWLSSNNAPALAVDGTNFALNQQCPVLRDAITEKACIQITTTDLAFTPSQMTSPSTKSSPASESFIASPSTKSGSSLISHAVTSTSPSTSSSSSLALSIILPLAIVGMLASAVMTLIIIARLRKHMRKPCKHKAAATSRDKKKMKRSFILSAEVNNNQQLGVANSNQLVGDSSYQLIADSNSWVTGANHLGQEEGSDQPIADNKSWVTGASHLGQEEDSDQQQREDNNYQHTEESSERQTEENSDWQTVVGSDWQTVMGSELQTEESSVQPTTASSGDQLTEASNYYTVAEIEASTSRDLVIST